MKLSDTTPDAGTGGEDVLRAIGELNGATEAAAQAASQVAMDHEEMKGWFKTIAEVIMSIIK
jgi:hypothetical protein